MNKIIKYYCKWMINVIAKIWTTLDPLYFKFTRLTYVNQSDFQNVFRVRLYKYRGPDIILDDGTTIHHKDLLIKIHLHNIRILNETKQIKGDLAKARYIQKLVKSSLPGLAQHVLNHSKNNEIKGIIGVTTIRKCIRPLGFSLFEISNPITRLVKYITCSIIYLSFHRLSMKTLQSLKHQKPVCLVMSKQKLFNYIKR